MRVLLVAALLLLPGCVELAARGPCVQLSLDPESAYLQAGHAQAFVVRARNCGDVALTLGDSGRCDAGNGLNLTLVADGMPYRLGLVGGAIPLARDDPHVCSNLTAPPRTLAPGESQQARLVWNGTLMESTCFRADCVESYHDAAPGNHTLVARVEPLQGGSEVASLLVHLSSRT